MSDHQSDGTDDAISGTMLAGKYRVRRELGRGLIGRVYLCRSSWNDALVAVKVLHPELAQMPGMAKRFLHELRAITQLDQQNIVPVFESGEDANQGLLYLAMEHIEGRNLAEVIEHDWPLSDARVVDLMSQLLRALARAHAIGIVHRDLKPTNVFVRASREGERDRVLVGDFSLAQLAPVWLPNASSDPAARAAGAQLLRGTAEYASPEQAQGKPLDPRSDVYSAGVLLFQMLTRTLPFMAANAADIGAQHCGKPPPPPSGFGKVNEALEAACLKALSKTRDARFQTANEMRDALEAAVGAEAS
ncbi:MAG TPA: serine/threonine-protein kinase, partial [Polyangiales bacterium]